MIALGLWQLDRRTEGLAPGEQLLRRAADGQGLTRPELAVLLSSSKLALQAELELGTLADDPVAEGILLADFPVQLREEFAPYIKHHRLRHNPLPRINTDQGFNTKRINENNVHGTKTFVIWLARYNTRVAAAL